MANNQQHNQRQRLAARPRAIKALKWREAGLTWREIGAKLGGVSAQRAQKLAKSHG